MTTHAEDPPLENHHATYRPRVICRWILGLMILATVVLVTLAWVRFGTDRPTVYEDSVEHFKYGSTGGEREAGFPYWIWKALPKVCADYLPGEGYASLGMLYEPGKDLPIGVSKRRVTGIDRVFLNCAACHTNTYRSTPDGEPQVVAGMPANSFDLMGFTRFFFDCAADGRFTPKHIMPTIQALNADLDLIDRYLVYPLAVLLMRDQLMMLRQRFAFIAGQPAWGPGRVDTFNTNKVQFNFPMDRLAPEEAPGTTDFPSIWNQRQRQGMQLHWDGNNSRVEERNRNASFGTGATPPTLDRSSIKRMENWLLDAQPPAWPFGKIDPALSARGKDLYQRYCLDCHGTSGTDFTGKYVGTVLPIEEIGTDRHRLDSFTRPLALNLATVYAGYGDERFSHFRKTNGYANMPLDGIWLRAPYLHNGSVPTLRDLLEPSDSRPRLFYRGNDLYDPENVGFVSDLPAEGEKRYFLFDSSVPGNSNSGHEGPAYGTDLSSDDKRALVEYLKTF
ncbi:MAG: cytochrome c [Gammaproteobacteria bacterium]|nr:cytochrome c [Gammaproteobacteria bacterium]